MSGEVPTVVADVAETIRTDYVGFASFTVLVWDHIITFADEVEYIWKGKKGPIVYLFFLNRYFTPLGFIINLYAYLSPSWTVERCARFIRYEGVTVAFAVEVVGLMMSLRIKALYPHRPGIAYFLWFLLLIETGLNAWLISGGRAVPHNTDSGIHACSMIFDPRYHVAASSSAWFPLLYDSIVLCLTMNRTWPSIRRREAGYIIKRLFEDGLLYYSVIFSVTLVLTIMIVAAPPGLQNITAQLEQLITVAMMSRITLNLRKAGKHAETEILAGDSKFLFFHRRRWWDDDLYVETQVSTNISPPTNSEDPESPSSPTDMPATPPEAVLKSTNLRFVHPATPTPDSIVRADPFSIRGHDSYEMEDMRPKDASSDNRFRPPCDW